MFRHGDGAVVRGGGARGRALLGHRQDADRRIVGTARTVEVDVQRALDLLLLHRSALLQGGPLSRGELFGMGVALLPGVAFFGCTVPFWLGVALPMPPSAFFCAGVSLLVI